MSQSELCLKLVNDIVDIQLSQNNQKQLIIKLSIKCDKLSRTLSNTVRL
jgi:hypothetical protein